MPGPKILESLFRAQIARHPWMKQDMAEYKRMKHDDPNKCYEWLHDRVQFNIEESVSSATRTD